MFISAQVYDALLAAGVQVVDRGDQTVDLLLPSYPVPVPVEFKAWSRSVGPAVIDRLASTRSRPEGLLVIAPSFSPGVRATIEGLGWSWIAAPEGRPVAGRLQVTPDAPIVIGAPPVSDASDVSVPARGRRPWQRHAIIRHLLLGHEWTQADLVDVCQTTQPRVSQVLKELLAGGFVARARPNGASGPATWIAVNTPRLIDSWLTTYPGPGGAAPTYWLGLDAVVNQAGTACSYIERSAQESTALRGPVVSGDAAADFVAPVRRSQLAVVYSATGVDLTSVGFTPAPRQDATLKLVVPTDVSVWPHPRDDRSRELAPSAPYQLADPLQVAWDLLDSETPDADQAADAVTAALLKLREQDQWP